MKKIFFSILLFVAFFKSQSQAIRISVQAKTGEAVKPLTDTKFEITLNDTIKTELTSGSDGMLGKIMVDPGTYKIVLTNPSFISAETNNVVVTERKLTSVTITCTPSTPHNSEKKKTAK